MWALAHEDGTPKQLTGILTHLLLRGSITNVEAQAVYRVRALPRRISDLEERGVSIERHTKSDPTGQRYVRYTLVN